MKPISAIFVLLAVLICLCPAFADTLTLPASLTVIEEEAFYGDTSLSSVVLPEGLKEIKAGAFASSTISAINLPSTLESIDDTALPAPGTIQVTAEKGTWSYGWAVEKGYIVPEASSLDDFVIENGVVTQYVGAGGDVVIPSKDRDGNDVVGIGNHSFFECTNVTSVVIPNSVTYIEDGLEGDIGFPGLGAFQYCTGLKSISIPSSITRIGDEAFFDCESLTSITIPDGVTSIGNEAFYWCSSLMSVTIPNSVTSIGARVFEDCFSLTSVTIGNSVTSIGAGAFDECPVLTSISVDSANQYYSSLNGALFNKQQSTLIAFPGGLQGGYVIPNSVTSIGEGAFGGSGLTSVTIPNSVTSIGKQAFWSCCLTSVTIPNSVTNMGENAFVLCDRLTSVTIENSVIGRGAFYECHDLTNVTIGDSVTSIGVSAFYMCRSLTSVTIPNSVTSIGVGAFNMCRSLTSVTIGNGVTSIGEDAFSGCTSLTSVAIPNSVTSIGEGAFEDCNNLTAYVVPGSYAEQYCKENAISYLYRSTDDIINNACLSLTLDRRFYKVGSDISITTTMTGGTAPYRYIYVMSIDNGASEVSEWTDSNTHTFMASRMGKTRIGVMVQDSTGAFSNPTIIEATINDTGLDIPVGAPTYNGHYYYVYEIDSIKTWEMAEIYCESKGGYLATITSQEENDFVYNNVVRAEDCESSYFGLTDHNERGVWRWVNDEKVDYLNWSYGEPNNEYGDEDYAMFYHEYTNGTWNDGCFGKRTGNQGCAFIYEWGDYVRDTGVIQTARDYRNWGKQSDTIRPVEYALLCACCNKASEAGSRSQMESDFYNLLSRFPEGHPLHVDSSNPSMSNIGRDNIIAYREGSENAMEAIQITIDSSHAIVVFAGTTSFEDGLQDALILYDSNIFNLSPDAVEASLKMFDPENVFHESQPEAANRIIRQIASQGFGHLYVTGHSLGGHLAADVTLHNEEVEECMTFDPPGRGEAWFQNWFNSGRTSKIVNYQFVGSPVHMVGHHVGLSLSLNVEANWNYPPLLWWHDIEKAYDKLGGNSAIMQR